MHNPKLIALPLLLTIIVHTEIISIASITNSDVNPSISNSISNSPAVQLPSTIIQPNNDNNSLLTVKVVPSIGDDARGPLPSSGISIIAKQDLNCKTKSPTGTCQKCYHSYYYSSVEQLCIPVSPLCQTWNDSGACLTCYSGYHLVLDLCVIITDGWDQSEVQDPNCAKYNGNSCVQCAFRFYFNKQKVCTTVHPDCKTWDKVTGGCLSCFDGFDLKTDSCVVKNGSIFSLIAELTIPTQTAAVNTNTAPVLNTSIATTTNTTLNETANETTIATTNTTTNSTTNSSPTFSQIQNCAQYSNTTFQCTKCSFRFYSQNGSCQKVSDLCKKWSEQDGKCTSCYSGYELSEGACLIRDPFCTIKTTEGCVQCANRYYLDTGLKCRGVSALCRAYDPLTGGCTECYDGYQLKDGACGIGV